MDVGARMEVVRELCSFEERLAGTDAERRAAGWLAARLRASGRRCEVEPTYVHPQYGLVHAAHCALGFGGSMVAVAEPAIGFATVLLAAASTYLDLNYRLYLIRSLFFRRASQNVVSPGPQANAAARVILCAHYDAARTGAVFRPRTARRAARISARAPLPLGPFRVIFWSLAALLPILGARMAGLDTGVVSILQLPPTLVLLVAVFALVDITLSPVVPGANDNASGVATVLSLAEELDREPPANLDVWVLLTGGEECLQEGMRAFVRSHRRSLDRESTYFVAVDSVGQGLVRYETLGGWVVSYAADPRLVALCAALAEAEEPRVGAEPLRNGSAGDSMPPRIAGFPAIEITCRPADGPVPHRHQPSDTPEAVDPAALERAHAFTLRLLRLLDRDITRASAGR